MQTPTWKTYHFTIQFRGIDYMSEELADRLYEAGCDDCLPGSHGGHAYAGFDRKAGSLESAIASAIRDVRKAGCEVERVEIENEDLDTLILEPTA